MSSKEENARAALAKLEKDSKHTVRTPEADKQTRDDDMKDPKFHRTDGVIDLKWRLDKNGHWDNPDFEK